MALLFLALVPGGHAKREKTRLQEHAIIYVMKTEVMTVEKIIQKGKRKLMVNSEETICFSLQSSVMWGLLVEGMRSGH